MLPAYASFLRKIKRRVDRIGRWRVVRQFNRHNVIVKYLYQLRDTGYAEVIEQLLMRGDIRDA